MSSSNWERLDVLLSNSIELAIIHSHPYVAIGFWDRNYRGGPGTV